MERSGESAKRVPWDTGLIRGIEVLQPPPPTDLEFITGTYPYDNSFTGVFVKNKNTARGIVASVVVEGASTLQVHTPDGGLSKPRWPLRFEVRVPPGSQVLVGVDTFRVIQRYHYGAGPGWDVVPVFQQYSVE